METQQVDVFLLYSYLTKLIVCNMLEGGKNLIILDAESEYVDLCKNLDGCYIDMMNGNNIINILEPKLWSDEESDDEKDLINKKETVIKEIKKQSRLSQHISFLRDFFKSYKNFDDSHIDTLEIIIQKLYVKFNINDNTDFDSLSPTDYPILSDLYELLTEEQSQYTAEKDSLYTEDILQHLRRSLHSMCMGAESKYLNGHTNVDEDKLIVFGVKELLKANENIKNALLFNILSYMSNYLLTKGHTVAVIDELYLFLSNLTAVTYIRDFMKRVRKKESAMLIASQNVEDFMQAKIAELTKPLFAIPVHQFLFNPGNISPKAYMDILQLDENLFDLIKYPEQGVCVFRHGIEVYNLAVKAQKYKAELFGTAGGR